MSINTRYILRQLYFIVFLFVAFSLPSFSASVLSDWQIQREKDLNLQNQKNIPKAPDIRTDINTNKSDTKLETESPCFDIKKIELQGSKGFEFALTQTLEILNIKDKVNNNNNDGICVGQKGIVTISNTLQNSIIAKGYTTTRVLLKEQDLKSKVLKIDIVAGMVDKIRFEDNSGLKPHEQNSLLFSAMPLNSGDILNIRPIEQALENFKRVPGFDASFDIVPSSKPSYSDIVIKYQKSKFPFRIGFSIDDSGSTSTGKYQFGTTLSGDNLLGLNDIFYLSYSRDMAGYDKTNITDNNGTVNGSTNGKSDNFALNYSFPVGYYLLSFGKSKYHYDQAVAGTNQVYRYAGNSETFDIGISRVIYRSDKGKTTFSLKGLKRSSDNYIDDARITVQDRKTTSIEYGLAHKQFIDNATLDMSLKYKVGIGAFDPLRAPEEAFGEGVSKPKIWIADISFVKPFLLQEKQLNFTSTLHTQTTATPLVPQDRLAIGGRYTVRGFDGDYSLSSNKGFYLQNELSFSYLPSHQFYIAIDGGKVYGQSVDTLIGQSLVGTALGVRGVFMNFGNLNYDLFAGTPIYKPQGFDTAKVSCGFNINYSF
ncbi:MAG: ShlB/FhaC/HecB family hemolysin secretion/activation protein [Sulfurovaceae bacterium]|nr:ShlB/FhaC/HecB family hemolysin secretion/activation protein [Sulfurovaceae bacterium]MDD5548626.1 ShlB/FhaC/HecB family hemolysin secretion/activation protein [Sulfurovaceae bacterium]